MSKFKMTLVAGLAATLTFSQVSAMAGDNEKRAQNQPNLANVATFVNTDTEFAGLFDTLLTLAVGDPEVLDVLTGNRQFTVLAPTDDAFDALFAVAAQNCIGLDAGAVNAVLKYHVIPGRWNDKRLTKQDDIRTALGAFFAQSGGVITDNAGQTANIIATNIPASNGFIHAIDTVILPFPVVDQCD